MTENDPLSVCCEVLRLGEASFNCESPMDSLNYMMAMLLWKSASDRWEDRRAFWVNRFAGDKVQVDRRLKWERFLMPEGCLLKDQWAHLGSRDIGCRINGVLREIEEANAPLLTGLLTDVDFTCERRLGSLRDRNPRLRRLLEGLNNPVIDFRSSDSGRESLISQVVCFLVNHFGTRMTGRGGGFLTSPLVCQLVAKLLSPSKGCSIYDPVCGSGALLLALSRETGGGGSHLFGQDKNRVMLSVCRLRLLLQGVDSFCGLQGDSLSHPGWYSGARLSL